MSAIATFAPGAVPTLAAASLPATSSCVDGWLPVPLPANLAAMEPQGGAVLNAQPAWVVGLASATAEGKRVPLIGHWVNGAWVKTAAPWTTYGVLNAVVATSDTNAWTAGDIGTYTRWPIAGRWNGTAWRGVSVPKPSGQLGVFADMASTDDARFWAVGLHLVNGRAKPLAMLHDTTGWSTRSPSVDASAEAGLTDVTIAPNTGTVWLGGWKTTGSGQARAWLLRRINSVWQTSQLAPIPGGRAAITDLAFTATGGWAVGFVDGAQGYLPFLQHWNGSAWSVVALPWAAGRSVVLNAVDENTDGDLVVAGTEIDELRQDILAVRSGATWQVTSLSAGTADRATFTDTAPVTGGAMAVGFYDKQPITMMPCAAPVTPAVPTLRSAPSSAPKVEPDETSAEGSVPLGTDRMAVAPVPIDGTAAMDMTAAAGLDAISAPTWGGVAADFDGDKLPDLFINRHYQLPPLMMVNGKSRAFSQLAGDFAKRDRHRCGSADVDGDGSLDLFCSIGVNKGTSVTPAELTLDPGDAGGTWASREFGVMDGYGRGRDATFLNLNGDAYPDLYVVNEASRSDAMWSSNRLYRNVAGGGFVSAPDWGVDRSMGGSCVTVGDINGDGLDDLVVCTEEPLDGVTQGIRVFMNESGKLVDRTAALGLTPKSERDVELADFNGDHKLDLALINGSDLAVYLNTNGALTKAYDLPVTGAVATATGDVNGDGLPDIYVARRTASNQGHLMLVNNGDGTSFTSMTIPEPAAGSADDVLALDYDGNGRTDFVTLNGWNVYGPVKLTAFFAQ